MTEEMIIKNEKAEVFKEKIKTATPEELAQIQEEINKGKYADLINE